MPAYNAGEFIGQAIESVLAQTWHDFELIVVDDGSKDDTLTIVERYASKDGRIRVFTQPNSGTAPTLNRAIEIATSQWVFIMHADDLMHANRIERQMTYLAEYPELAVLSSLVRHIDSKNRVIGKDNSKLTTYEAVSELVARNELIGFNHPAVVLRKDVVLAIGGYRQAFWPAEDLDLWNRLVEKGYRVLVQPEYLLDYRIHGNAASVSRARLTRAKVRWLKDCMIRRRSGDVERSWEQFLADEKSAPLLTRIDRGRKDLAKILYKKAVSYYACRQYLSCAFTLAGALFLQPRLTVSQVISKSTFRQSEGIP